MPKRVNRPAQNRRIERPSKELKLNVPYGGFTFEYTGSVRGPTNRVINFTTGITRRRSDFNVLRRMIHKINPNYGARLTWEISPRSGKEARYLQVTEAGKQLSREQLKGLFRAIETLKRKDGSKMW
jgi:hypothetical protein